MGDGRGGSVAGLCRQCPGETALRLGSDEPPRPSPHPADETSQRKVQKKNLDAALGLVRIAHHRFSGSVGCRRDHSSEPSRTDIASRQYR
jgi:hypothetical protein